jgi:hypothetical protein
MQTRTFPALWTSIYHVHAVVQHGPWMPSSFAVVFCRGVGFSLGTGPGFFFFSLASLALTTILLLAKLPDFFGLPALERRQSSKRVELP